MKIKVFCTKCGDSKDHEGSVSGSDLLFTCGCGHFVKFPQVKDKKELQGLIDEHESINKPLAEERRKAAESEKLLADLLK